MGHADWGAKVTESSWQESKQRVEVLGRSMAYVDKGEGPPIVLLHGNPTSSFLWRTVIAELTAVGRCVAPDLIGMGDSDKLPADDIGRYTFVSHREFVDAFMDEVVGTDERVILVVHDWGSALGFDWARRHPDRVRGIAYMEAIVAPVPGWDVWPEQAREIFQGFRSPAGEEMILQQNLFIEGVLPMSVIRTLSDAEMAEYRRPFTQPGEDRLPTLTWPRQIPIAGEPADVHEIVQGYAAWLAQAEGIPKLFVNAEPGAILTGPACDFCRSWPDQSEITVPGIHYIQEDSGPQIGRAIAEWLPA